MSPALLAAIAALIAPNADDPPITARAARVHADAILIDGHNDLPWRLRSDGDVAFETLDIAERLDSGHTDIPRLREGGVDAQFWSVYIPSEHPDPSKTVLQQIDLVYRMAERYPDAFAIARTADDVERIVGEGKVASLIGIEGGVAIEEDLALLRTFGRLGVRYMTLTHNKTLPWADAATDEPRSDGLSPFGERVVREMNRLGILVDISHVAPTTMEDALRVSEAPVIASHSSAYALCPHPRNVPDAILERLPDNGGVVMVNFYPGFIVAEASEKRAEARERFRAKYPDDEEAAREAYADLGRRARGRAPRRRRAGGRPHRPHRRGRRDRPRRHRRRLRRHQRRAGRARRRLGLPALDRGIAGPRLLGGRRGEGPRRQRAAGPPRGRGGRRAAPVGVASRRGDADRAGLED